MKKQIILLISIFILLSGTAFGQPIRLTTVNWEPFYGDKLPEGGFFTALSKAVFKRAGYDLTVSFTSWSRALELAKQGKFDGLLGAYYNKERAGFFVFTDPLASNEEVLIQKKGGGISYASLADLKPYTIGGMKGSAVFEEIRQSGIQIETTLDYLASLRKLKAGRIDLVIMGKQNFNYALANDSAYAPLKGAVEIISPPYNSAGLFCAISKKRPDADTVAEKFNTALKTMKADGTYDAILKRFGQ